MTEEVKSDYYSVTVIRRSKLKVAFEEPLTLSEAKEAVLYEEWEDVIDEEDFGILDVEIITAL